MEIRRLRFARRDAIPPPQGAFDRNRCEDATVWQRLFCDDVAKCTEQPIPALRSDLVTLKWQFRISCSPENRQGTYFRTELKTSREHQKNIRRTSKTFLVRQCKNVNQVHHCCSQVEISLQTGMSRKRLRSGQLTKLRILRLDSES